MASLSLQEMDLTLHMKFPLDETKFDSVELLTSNSSFYLVTTCKSCMRNWTHKLNIHQFSEGGPFKDKCCSGKEIQVWFTDISQELTWVRSEFIKNRRAMKRIANMATRKKGMGCSVKGVDGDWRIQQESDLFVKSVRFEQGNLALPKVVDRSEMMAIKYEEEDSGSEVRKVTKKAKIDVSDAMPATHLCDKSYQQFSYKVRRVEITLKMVPVIPIETR